MPVPCYKQAGLSIWGLGRAGSERSLCIQKCLAEGKIANALGMVSIANKYKISVKNTLTTIVLFQIYSLISGTLLISIFIKISVNERH